MASFNMNEFYEYVVNGREYNEICEHFGIKTKEQFKRRLYDLGVSRGKFVTYEFPKNKKSVDVIYRKEGFIKLSNGFVEKAFSEMGITGDGVALSATYDADLKQIIVSVAA